MYSLLYRVRPVSLVGINQEDSLSSIPATVHSMYELA
jgi:hypothetical protein